ncbi:response regulator transcription factor [Novosphingobium pentaromativorans]|uniref:Regulatory protein VirG n=1 Tax=Novosphingobium pentaromativorans US6-1 TaxID=1088721 RepID=G6EK53_9SPHN|nr:response regulator transcription factor [Novosphingobium pentaromativorans]EHJ58330.1 two-component response regulator [Novosphingobium pentaromativorans US6-1]
MTGPSIPRLSALGPQTILIVDDDIGMRRALHRILRSNGFRCLLAEDGAAMRSVLAEARVDLILLDVMMPGQSGFDLCRDLRIRDDNPVPIIMISARGEQTDLVIGLELGADDYIAKPFGEGELLARVRAMLRRSRTPVAEPARTRSRFLRFDGWTVDLGQRDLFTPTGARVELSGAEFDLLLALIEHPQRVIGRDALLEMSRARIGNASDRTIDVHICRLRRKLGDEEKRETIRTVRGFGYIFTRPVEQA